MPLLSPVGAFPLWVSVGSGLTQLVRYGIIVSLDGIVRGGSDENHKT